MMREISCGFQDLTFIAHSEMAFQYLNAPLEQNLRRPWLSTTMGEGRSIKWKNDVTENEETGRKTGHRKLCARGHWRPHEDAKLKELVSQYGPQNWNIIAEKLEGRSGKSCRLRWFNQLDPRLNRRGFTEEEEEKLLAAHRMYGNKWAMIARIFPGRTDNGVKNHWHVIMARKNREQNSFYRRRKLSCSRVQTKGFSLNNIENYACIESTMTNDNIIDQSAASNCTDLSLTPSSVKMFQFFSRFRPVQHHNLLESKIGEEKVLAHSNRQDYGNKPMAHAAEVDQSGHSDSNSEVTAASESVANYRANPYMFGENENGKFEKNNIAFIDFLGVGAT
ncbi:transcription factor CSA-like isoform X2 [Olea europaea var. sylvestris]|uniref:transcription factor CSA-like isoform X2 n=1 Tax=Olea europaea var. sylvestris TaxID=158386 RepID=UPI000C1D70A9|nr:transcription factor CSA-like isoform X2 [Olea europaea var. sylvestris]